VRDGCAYSLVGSLVSHHYTALKKQFQRLLAVFQTMV
jgi:hypothetical protein